MAEQSRETAHIDTAPLGGLRGFFRPLANHAFRRLWLGESVSLLGGQFYLIALPWLTLRITGSGVALGTVLMAAALPQLLFMLIGGALADRFSPHRLLLASNLARLALSLALTVLVWQENITLPMLYGFAFAFGIADAFFQPAMLAIVPGLVEPGELEPSNALLQATGQLSEIAGPALAGLVLATSALWVAFAIDAASFLFTTLMLLGIRAAHPAPGAHEPAGGLLGDVLAGLRIFWREPAMRVFLLLIVAINLFLTGPLTVGMPALAERRFAGSASAFGALLAALGAGALAGTLLAGTLGMGRRLGVAILGLAAAIGAGVALLGVAPTLLLACAVTAAIGMGISFANVHIMAWLQRRTPPELLGRVMSVAVLAAVGLDPLSRAVTGFAIDLNLGTMFLVAGGGLLLVALLGATSRSAREIG